MYRYQTLSKDQLTNAVLCFADRISCEYCPIKEECLKLDKESIELCCEKMLIDFLTGEIPYSKTMDFYDGFNEGFNIGYETCKKAIIEKLQKGRKKNENTR